jgi:hypothetical protein
MRRMRPVPSIPSYSRPAGMHPRLLAREGSGLGPCARVQETDARPKSKRTGPCVLAGLFVVRETRRRPFREEKSVPLLADERLCKCLLHITQLLASPSCLLGSCV